MAMNTTGDITNRTAAWACRELLKRGIPHLNIEKFGQVYVMPKNSTGVARFRRFEALDNTPTFLTEGVTPTGKKLTFTDVQCTLQQMGDGVQITDVVMDQNEDPVLTEAIDILGEQAPQMVELYRWGIIKAGTNVLWANQANDTASASRTDICAPITLPLIRKAVRALMRQNAKEITRIVRSTPSYGTLNVPKSFIALCHVDVKNDVEDLTGFKPVEDYGAIPPYENEFGAVAGVRFLTSTLYSALLDSGTGIAHTPVGGAAFNLISNGGVNCDIYQTLILAQNAYGLVPLKGANALTPMVTNPKPSDSDPWAQRGWVTWKSTQTAAILNDAWMIRLEHGVKA